MRKAFLSIIIAGMSAAAMAQGGNLTVDFGGGYQTLSYKMQDGVTRGDGKAGFTGQIGYQYYFTPNWGIGIGLSVRNFNASSVADYMQATPNAIDDDGESCEYRVYYNKLRESQKAMQVSFPVGLYYQKALAEKWTLVSGLGVRVDFATDNSYLTDAGNLDTRGWYERTNLELPNVPNHHYYTASDFSGSYKMNTSASAFLNIGAYYAIFPDLEIGALAYGTCGLSKLTDGSNSQLYFPDVQSYANPAYNGVLNSEAAKGSRTVAIGGALSLRIRFGRPADGKKIREPESSVDRVVHQQAIDSLNTELAQLLDSLRNQEAKVQKLQEEIIAKDVIIADGKSGNSQDAPVTHEVEQAIEVLGRVNFGNGTNDAVVSSVNNPAIDKLVDYMNQYPDVRIEAIGHTCNQGSLEYNKMLGLKRAENLKQELVKRGISSDRITTVSKWYSEPIAPNTFEVYRALNRRVEVRVLH